MTAFVVNEPTGFLLHSPVTVTGESDTELFTKATHGLSVGDCVVFTALTGGTGLATHTPYYVKTAPDAGTFTLAASPGGATQEYSTDVTASTMYEAIELDDHLVDLTIDRPSEAIDVRTFTLTRASDAGGGQDTITLALLWDPDLHDALVAHEDELCVLLVKPDAADDQRFTATVQYAVTPFGKMTIGGKVEATLVLGVEDGVTYVDPA